MSELERVTKNFDLVLESMKKEGAQDSSVSLALICQGTIEIAKELALLNDNMKENQKDEQCKSGASASD